MDLVACSANLARTTDFAVDSRTAILGRFHLKHALPPGGMAELWLAEDDCGDDVVLKTVHTDFADDLEARARFQREIEVTALFDHENVVPHVAHGSWHGVDVLALEHIRGVNLAHMLAHSLLRSGPVLRIAEDIARSLAYVHALAVNGVPLDLVHGDVSPENIVIDTDGCAHLIDFGNLSMRGMEHTGKVVGKPGYLSPEQARGELIDARTDQYPLGVVCWEMFAGRGLSSNDYSRVAGVVPPLSTFTTVPENVEATLARMLAADRNSRFANMDDCADAISALGIPERADDDREWLGARAGCPRRNRKWRRWEDQPTVKCSRSVVGPVPADVSLAHQSAPRKRVP